MNYTRLKKNPHRTGHFEPNHIFHSFLAACKAEQKVPVRTGSWAGSTVAHALALFNRGVYKLHGSTTNNKILYSKETTPNQYYLYFLDVLCLNSTFVKKIVSSC